MKIWDRTLILTLLLVNYGTFHRIIYCIIPCFLSHISSHISLFSIAFFPRPCIVVHYFTGFNYELNGLSIVVSEREGETDEEISFTYDPNHRIKSYNLDHFRYVQYVRLTTAADPPGTTGMVFDEVEVYAFSEYHFTNCSLPN